MSVKPGWRFLEDPNFIVSGDELRVLEFLEDTEAPNAEPAFTCWRRRVRSRWIPNGTKFMNPYSGEVVEHGSWLHLPNDPPEFDIVGWVTGFDYGEVWLNGGNPGMMITGRGLSDETNPFAQMGEDA